MRALICPNWSAQLRPGLVHAGKTIVLIKELVEVLSTTFGSRHDRIRCELMLSVAFGGGETLRNPADGKVLALPPKYIMEILVVLGLSNHRTASFRAAELYQFWTKILPSTAREERCHVSVDVFHFLCRKHSPSAM